MSGGAGFISDSNKRLKDNHKLGKFREKISFSSSQNDPNYRKNADSKSLNEAISHRFKRKKELRKIGRITVFLIGAIILAIIYFA